MRLTYYESLKSNKSYHDKSTYTVRSCLREFYWIYRCKRIANADTQNIRITNADGQTPVFDTTCKFDYLNILVFG